MPSVSWKFIQKLANSTASAGKSGISFWFIADLLQKENLLYVTAARYENSCVRRFKILA